MSRRHLIVHRADRNVTSGPGQHRAASISRKQVEKWIDVVERFGTAILACL
jgi:hypothetical protein